MVGEQRQTGWTGSQGLTDQVEATPERLQGSFPQPFAHLVVGASVAAQHLIQRLPRQRYRAKASQRMDEPVCSGMHDRILSDYPAAFTQVLLSRVGSGR